MLLKRRLLWVGDAGCQTGFARCTHGTLDVIRRTWDVSVLGINYRGDPHPFPYDIYPAAPGGDMLGVGRLKAIIKHVDPHALVFQNDTWNFPAYYRQGLAEGTALLGAVAIDGKNCRGEYLNPLDTGIFWTQFGLDQARTGGFTSRGAVIPLGVDTGFWTVGNKDEARQYLFGEKPEDYAQIKNAFIILNVNRNQPRKRMDLTVRYFAKFVKGLDASATEEDIRAAPIKLEDAFLYLHVAPTGDLQGYDVDHLALYYGINKQVILSNLGAWNGVSDSTLRSVYQAADLGISTTQGEGWGLPAMEGMACGLPQILPNWAAYGEWAAGAAELIPCTSTDVTWKTSVIGGIPDEKGFLDALWHAYCKRSSLSEKRRAGLALVARPEFRWQSIGERFRDELDLLVPRVD